MSAVEAKPLLNGYELEWPKDKIKIKVSRLADHHDGLKGEIVISSTIPKAGHLHQAQFNFSSSMARSKLAKDLLARDEKVKWEDILEVLCVKITAMYRQGAPVTTLWSLDELQKPEYLVYPFLLKGEINMIFGEGGSGKSYLTLYLAAILALQMARNPLELAPATYGQTIHTLLLDWETHSDIIGWRWKLVVNGLGMAGENVGLPYRECHLPLVDDLEAIQGAIEETKADLVIIDSLGMAAGGDINQQQIATGLMNAIRALKKTALVIHHTAKNATKATPFGSAYLTNTSRSIFQISKTQLSSDTETISVLSPYKFNYSGKLSPVGVRIGFSDLATNFERVDASTIPDLMGVYSVTDQITATLEEFGEISLGQILEHRTELNSDEVETALRLGKDTKYVATGNGKWRLL